MIPKVFWMSVPSSLTAVPIRRRGVIVLAKPAACGIDRGSGAVEELSKISRTSMNNKVEAPERRMEDEEG